MTCGHEKPFLLQFALNTRLSRFSLEEAENRIASASRLPQPMRAREEWAES